MTWLTFLSFTLSTFMVSPYLSIYAQTLGADLIMVGVIYAVATFTTLVSRIPAARLAGKVGEELMIGSGLVLTATGMITYAVATSPLVLILGSFLRGLGFGIFHPSALTLSVETEEGEVSQPKTVGYVLTAPPIGMTIGPLIGVSLISAGSYKLLFITGAVVSLLGAFQMLARKKGDNNPIQSSQKPILSRRMAYMMFGRFVLSFSAGAFLAFLPLLAVASMKFSEWEVGLLFMITGAANVVGHLVSGHMIGRIGAAHVAVLSLAMMSVSGALLSVANPALAWIAAALYGLAQGLFIPSSVFYVANIVPAEQRTMGLAYMTSMDVGSTAGSFGSAIVSDTFGLSSVFMMASLVSASGAGALLASSRRETA
ncbi:MAG: MFS transporter [Aigarchaeota archaeon]|nr:MFS transporter [Candidatus Pelearchaeum maunauluense]